MDGGRSGNAQFVEDKLSHHPALEQVIVGRPVITVAVIRTRRPGQVGSQSRRGVTTRDQHHPRIGDQRRRSSGRTRTRRTDHTDHILVRHDDLSSSLTPVIGTQIVKTGAHIDIETVNLPIVRNRQHDRPLDRQTEEGHITRNGVQGADLDSVSRLHLDNAQRTITEMIHHGHRLVRLLGGGGGRRRGGLRGLVGVVSASRKDKRGTGEYHKYSQQTPGFRVRK